MKHERMEIIQLGKVTTHRLPLTPLFQCTSASDVVIHIDDTQPLIGIAHIMQVTNRRGREKLNLEIFSRCIINRFQNSDGAKP